MAMVAMAATVMATLTYGSCGSGQKRDRKRNYGYGYGSRYGRYGR